MATFSSLATELLAHILHLSNEGEPAQERQRSRLAFGLISRACFLATTSATEFCVDGAAQAKAFIAQLEQEKQWAAQEERKARSGRASRSSALRSLTRVSNIRRLTLILDTSKNQKIFTDLLRATRNVFALELVVGASEAIQISSQLAVALGGLVGLLELRIHGLYLDGKALVQFLIPLKALEVLDLEVQYYEYHEPNSSTTHLNYLSLPHLRNLRIQLKGTVDDFPSALLNTLAAKSTNGIRILDLQLSPLHYLDPQAIDPLLPHLSNVVRLTWEAPLPYPVPTRARATNRKPIDHTLFDTLATLSSLEAVKLIVRQWALSSDHVIAYLDSHESLQSLSIQFVSYSTWTPKERDTVKDAAERAGVAFSFSQGKRGT
ncbi:hypothetical protein RQP46_008064 [Phenoliferia psychrophenolica]